MISLRMRPAGGSEPYIEPMAR